MDPDKLDFFQNTFKGEKMSEDVLEKIYTDPNSGAAFSHWKNLLAKAKEYDPDVKKEEVLRFLAKKPTHTLHAKTNSRHRRRAIKSHFPNHYIAIDLLQLSQESIKHNKPYKFILCSIDLFSRFLRLTPIRSKSIPDVKQALELLFSKMEHVPKKILSDLESSFYSKIIQSYLKSKNITLYSQQGAANLKYKNGVVERAQRTVRQLIAKICTEFDTENFIKYLSYIENIFNSKKNRSTKFSPKVLHSNRDAIASYQIKLLERDLLPDKTKEKFLVGDTVRYKLVYSIFSKESKKTFSKTIHTVTKVITSNPATFVISPPPTHKRLLYASDLVHAIPSDRKNLEDFPIESVTGLKRLPNGEILYSCSLIGHSQKELWLNEDELKSRYVLFPRSLDEVKEKNSVGEISADLSSLPPSSSRNTRSLPPLTRARKQEIIQNSQIITRSRDKGKKN